MKLKVYIDLDGTIFRTWEYLNHLLRMEFGQGLFPNEWVLSCWSGLNRDNPKQRMADDLLNSEEFYYTQPPRKDAIKVLPILTQFAEIIYLTSRVVGSLEDIKKMTFQHFPKAELILTESLYTKVQYVEKGNADKVILVDDNPMVMFRLIERNLVDVYGFYFTNFWNSHCYVPDVKRFSDWYAIHEILRVWRLL